MRVLVQGEHEMRLEALVPAATRGGEGAIHRFVNPDLSDICVKILHENRREDYGPSARREKVRTQQEMPEFGERDSLSWPQHLVYSEDGTEWLGYTMRHSDGFLLEELCHFQMVQQTHAEWKRSEMVRLCVSYLDACDFLHKRYVLIGDVNPRNVMVEREGKTALLIDCDSMHLVFSDKIFPCTVYVPSCMPPEFSTELEPSQRYTLQGELFSIAIVLARLWLLGKHPFATKIPPNTKPENFTDAANIRAGRCPLRVGNVGDMPPGPWENLWHELPDYVQECFVRTFVDGHSLPMARTSIDEWRAAFARYTEDLLNGTHPDKRMIDIAPWQKQLPPPLPAHVRERAKQQGGKMNALAPRLGIGCMILLAAPPLVMLASRYTGNVGVILLLAILAFCMVYTFRR